VKHAVLCRFGEIGIKGRKAQNSLKHRLKAQIKKLVANSKIEIIGGRIVIYTNWESIKGVKYLPGIVSFSPAVKVNYNLDEIEETALSIAKSKLSNRNIKNFAVRVRRLYTDYPIKSPDIERIVGRVVKDGTGLEVNLKHPDLFIGIEILRNGAYIYTDKIKGVGGLPVGEQGRVVSLLSGGIDSPVAAFLMLKRGARITFIHFSIAKTEEDKARKLYERFLFFDGKTKFIVVPHKEYIKKVSEILKNHNKARYTCIFCKRRIIKESVRIAKKIKAEGIVMGDSLGQVASQTLRNIHIIQKDIDFPIYRPLIGLDKLEIEKIAHMIGTYEISTSNNFSCQFVPKHPMIKGKEEDIERLEKIINHEAEEE